MEAKNEEKATLKAELAFTYEIKKYSAQKVDYLVVFVFKNIKPPSNKIEKCNLAYEKMASSRRTYTR